MNADKNTRRLWFHVWLKAISLLKAYGGSLLITSIGFPIFASTVTVSLYLAPRIKLSVLHLEHITSNWYAPVYGFLASCLVLLLFAAFRIHFATATGTNMNVHELLKNRLSELKARLGNIDVSDYTYTADSSYQEEYTTNIEKIQALFNVHSDDYYRLEALRKAYEAYCDLTYNLLHNHSATEWVLGTGYTHAWRIVHRAQEALLEVETVQEVISDVIHDVRSIQNSPINDSTTLVHKMLQALKDISPEAMAYFEELQADKNYADLFAAPITSQQHMSITETLLNFFKKKKPLPPPVRSNEMAREAIREVKHTLNLYQDTLRETLVRIRNRMLLSIALTGFVTYFLLCSVILWNTPSSAISTATIYYMIGAITGLFVRFYNESNNEDAPEDYGLFSARLIATPLLSGLAGIGGVLLTATISTLGGSGSALSLTTIFQYPANLDYLIAAAIFGYAPNLIIGTLQQRAQKYSTDLQNSKGERTSKDE